MQSDGSIKKHLSGLVLFIVFLAVVSVWFSSYLCQRQAAGMLTATVTESDAFRKMRLSEHTLTELKALASAGSMTMGEILATLYPFCPDGFLSLPSWVHTGGLSAWRGSLLKNNRTGYLLVRNAYAAIWDDVKCFPVAGDAITYENSWMFERTYGGKRGHEGTDLMPPDNLSGVYPVLSMTDGIVENIGWLEQGGYRIGIRSGSGGYFYYAHLDSYAREFAIGESVYAGEQLGLMGDSGYGGEGTRGRFAVHLHLGIYIRTEQSEEISVNPYWVLRYAQL